MSTDRLGDAPHQEFSIRIHEAITWDNIQRFLPPPGGRILDAGGGSGRWAVRLARMGYHVTLTDISASALETARRHLSAKGLLDRVIIEQMDIRDLGDLASDSFHLALAYDVLSCCGDPQQAISEMARVTRPGGHVIVSVESRFAAVQAIAAGDWERAEQILATGQAETEQTSPSAQPTRFFSIAEIKGYFEQHNLEIVRVVGRPVFAGRLPPEVQRKILQQPQALERLIRLETRYASDPGWAGAAPYFEMVGLKKEESSVKLFRKVWSV